ncbi:hypothetical protein C817_01359 [Dorea sp. 5-2]|nr:hypothetical protein C817_01359 [Dorea sp. 5-2]
MNKIMDDISKWTISKREKYLTKVFEEKMGKTLELKNPTTFSEMIQWMKLYYHDPAMSRCADKVTFKDYAKEKLGKDYTVPIYQVWESAEDVDLNNIPEQCAIKSNCCSDGVNILLVTDKNSFDIKKAEKEIKENWFDRLKLHTNSFANYYYDVKPKVYAEEYIKNADDYDILCFHGEPKFVYVKTEHFDNGVNREVGYPVSFYTTEWEYINAKYKDMPTKSDICRPVHLDEMLEISRNISKDFPFVRVDFFENNGRVYLAELSFAPWAGLRPYEPESMDCEMGKWLDIVHAANPMYIKKN